MFGMNLVHELFVTKKGTLIMIDVADTWDAGIEGAYAIFDKEIFDKWWIETSDVEDPEDVEPWTIQDAKVWGEDAGAFDCWEVVSSHHRSAVVAEKNVYKAIKNL